MDRTFKCNAMPPSLPSPPFNFKFESWNLKISSSREGNEDVFVTWNTDSITVAHKCWDYYQVWCISPYIHHATGKYLFEIKPVLQLVCYSFLMSALFCLCTSACAMGHGQQSVCLFEMTEWIFPVACHLLRGCCFTLIYWTCACCMHMSELICVRACELSRVSNQLQNQSAPEGLSLCLWTCLFKQSTVRELLMSAQGVCACASSVVSRF